MEHNKSLKSDPTPGPAGSESLVLVTDPPARVRRGKWRRVRGPSITWDQIIGIEGWIKIGVIGALLGWLYGSELQFMWRSWVHDPNWSHGFLIPLFSLYFLHQRRERLYEAGRRFTVVNWAGLLLVVCSIFGYLVSIYPLKMGYPRLLALLATLLGTVFFCCGWRVIRVTWLPILFLFFAMPIPARWYESLTIRPRIWASQISAGVMGLIPNMEVAATGVVIEGVYQGTPFNLNVAEACAGMRLMMAFVALGVAMAYLSDRPAWHRIVLVLSTFPISLVCNFIRVVITGLLHVLVSPVLAQGGFHTLLGLLMLPVAFFFYWIIAEILNRVYEEVEIEEPAHA